MIRFQSLSVKDFGALHRADLQLSDRGLVLVSGINKDTDAADSNGSGKSTIFSALSWCLYGETVTLGKTVDVIRRGAKKAVVEVVFDAADRRYTVTRTRTSSATSLDLATDGEATSERGAKDTEIKIAQIIGLDWESFRSTVLFGQGDLQRFADPQTTDTQRKAVLKEVLRLDRFDVALKRVREARKELGEERRAVQTDLTREEGALGTLRISSARTQADQSLWEKSYAIRLKNRQEALNEINKPGEAEKKLAARLPRLQALVSGFAGLVEEEETAVEVALTEHRGADVVRAKADRCLDQLQDRAAFASERLKGIEEQITETEGSSDCPTCGQPVKSDARISEHRDALIQKRDREVAALASLQAEVTTATVDRVEAAVALLAAAEAVRASRASYALRKAKSEEVASQLRDALAAGAAIERYDERRRVAEERLEEARQEVNPHIATGEELEQRQAVTVKEIARLRAALDTLTRRDAPLVFWEEGFGNKGLPSLAMDAIMPVLTESANRYLGVLADGDITVKIGTERTLKSGASQESISILPTVEGYEGVVPSGGQRSKITLAVALALADLVAAREGSSVDLLLLDEVLDGLDAEGRSRVVALLRELREVRSTILVISHDPAVADSFETVITVTKDGGKAVLTGDDS